MKTQINATPPEDIPDPSAVLEAILGTSVSSGGETDPNNGQVEADDVERPSSLSEDVEFGSQSLQQFLNEHHKQDDSLSSTPYYSKQSVEECMSTYIRAVTDLLYLLLCDQMGRKRINSKSCTCP